MLLVTTALDIIQMTLEDSIGSDDFPINYVATLAAFLARLRPHKSELFPNSIGAARVQLLDHVISQDGVRTRDYKVAALPCMPMPADIKQLRSLLDGLSYYPKPLPSMARRIRPITTLLNQ